MGLIQIFGDLAHKFKSASGLVTGVTDVSIHVANRHLVCCECSSWIQFDTLGCTIPWGEMKGNTVFKCKGCTEVARLVGEVEYLRKMVESLKRMVTGQGLDETSGETGDREATLE